MNEIFILVLQMDEWSLIKRGGSSTCDPDCIDVWTSSRTPIDVVQ